MPGANVTLITRGEQALRDHDGPDPGGTRTDRVGPAKHEEYKMNSNRRASRLSATLAAFLSVGATVAFATLAQASTLQASGGRQIYRCDFGDGSVLFTDSPCRNARQMAPWRPPAVQPGLRRSAVPAPTPDKTPVNYGRVDPFVACQEKGGRFHVASRLCVLPSGDEKTGWVRADRP